MPKKNKASHKAHSSNKKSKTHVARFATAKASLGQLFETPFTTLLNIMLIAIAVSIPVVLKLAVDNLKVWAGYNENGLEITLYLNANTQDDQAKSLNAEINSWPEVTSAIYISKQAALEELKSLDHFNQALSQLTSNPLPASIRIYLPHSHDVQRLAETVISKTQQHPFIESVSFDMDWFTKAEAIINISQRIYDVITGFLSLGVLLVIGNTVRLTIDKRKEEILVNKLVGATNDYVRRPFIYMGMWIGALGAILGIAICLIGHASLNSHLAPLASAYDTSLNIASLGVIYTLNLIASCALLGFLGAWLICNSQLNKIAPE